MHSRNLEYITDLLMAEVPKGVHPWFGDFYVHSVQFLKIAKISYENVARRWFLYLDSHITPKEIQGGKWQS